MASCKRDCHLDECQPGKLDAADALGALADEAA